jgi:hypothetical protein
MTTTTTSQATMEQRVARLFGLTGDKWMRHANPLSVWTRFAVVPLIALAIWSRAWIGWYSLIPVALALTWMVVNPLFFPEPRSTRNWASKGVFGERVFAERNTVELPPQFLSAVPNVANALSAVGLVLLAYGLITFDPLSTIAGILVTSLGKLWYIDRMVLLFEDVKHRNAEYAKWEY